jgi:hypothetical protein
LSGKALRPTFKKFKVKKYLKLASLGISGAMFVYWAQGATILHKTNMMSSI